jgi:cytochrome P450
MERPVNAVRLPQARSCPFDPPDGYRALREHSPVSPLELELSPRSTHGWLITRLAEVRGVLADRAFSHRNDLLALPIPPPFPMDSYQPEPAAPGTFNKLDGAEHAKYRRLLTRYFTARKAATLASAAGRIAGELLASMAEAGPPADLVTAFAEPLATRLMCELVGVPEADRGELLSHLSLLGRMHYTIEELIAAVTAISGILDRLAGSAEKADGSFDQILPALARGSTLSREELVNVIWALLGGGFDTTSNMLALGVFALLCHPGQADELRGRPDLWENGIEELLRYLTVSHLGASRCAVTDVEVAGRTVRAGETVVLALGAANRDPARFADPDRLDVGRDTSGHVAFGHGVHQCIGQNVARVTLLAGFRALFSQFPDLHLAVTPDRVAMRDDMLHYGVHELPVSWEASRAGAEDPWRS